nr:molybdopterin-dependent oxidoreductase [uncultured Bacillus sp.]
MNLIEKATNYVLSRRKFIGWSAAITATTAGIAGNGLKKVKAEESKKMKEKEGEWITAACWHNCGGRCLNKVLVADGVVIRQKTDDTHPDSPDYPQQRGCQRGRSQRKQVFGTDRLKYPMKRKNWSPGGGKKELRGKDQWVRISWEEALDIVANETKRIKEAYGNKAILSTTGNTQLNLTDYYCGRALSLYGGWAATWGTTSWGALPMPCTYMQEYIGGVQDRQNVQKSKLIILWGANPIWSSGGSPTYKYLQAKKAGAKIIQVDPYYNPSASVLADEWIPVRPSTDAALLIGMAYHMITNNLYDKEFLDTFTVGFDADHMPEGVDPKGNFKDYVLGTYDGIPKTPEWASKICSTDPDVIKKFAQECATTKPAAFISSYAPARTYNGEQFVQAFFTVGWMTGNVGKPGAMVGISAKERAGDTGPLDPPLVKAGDTGVSLISNPLFDYGFPGPSPEATDWHGFVWDEVWDAVVTGEFTASVRGKQPCDIRMIWNIGDSSALNQMPNINRGIEAFRKVEFVVTSAHFLTSNAKYSDIVLPATTQWERWGGISAGNSGHGANRELLIYFRQVTKPLYECKDDIWMEKEIGRRLEIDPKLIQPIPLKQMVFNQLAGAEVIKEDGTGYEKLLTITKKDIAELGVEGKPQQGRITYKELEKTGMYQVKRYPGDPYGLIPFKDYIEDSVNHPLTTESGKFEIYCRKLAETVTAYGWSKQPPIAQYNPPKEGYEDTIASGFPIQLYTIHYGRRAHSALDNVGWLREAYPQDLIMNVDDAKKRGIKEGDIVKVTSRHGVVIRPVHITERMMPGVATLGEGAWVDKDDKTGIDKAGATNSLSGTNPNGQGVQPWNTNNIEIEKYDGTLEPDYKWPQRIALEEV